MFIDRFFEIIDQYRIHRYFPILYIGVILWNLHSMYSILQSGGPLLLACLHVFAITIPVLVLHKWNYQYIIAGYLRTWLNRPIGTKTPICETMTLGEKYYIYRQVNDDETTRETVKQTRLQDGPLWLRHVQTGYAIDDVTNYTPSQTRMIIDSRKNQLYEYDSATVGGVQCLDCGLYVPPAERTNNDRLSCKNCFTPYQTKVVRQIIIHK